jgi:Co/Zn/Cd efflux system component
MNASLKGRVPISAWIVWVGTAMLAVACGQKPEEPTRPVLDGEMDAPVTAEIRAIIEASPIQAEICDLHIWRVGKGKFACIGNLAMGEDIHPEYFRGLLRVHQELVHVTVEASSDSWPRLLKNAEALLGGVIRG